MDRHEPCGGLLHVETRIDHVQQQPRALEMGEEIESESVPLRRALEQTRNVENGDLAVDGEIHNAEHGLDRRKRIVGNLGLGVRDTTQKRRLADVGKAEQRGIGQQLELER